MISKQETIKRIDKLKAQINSLEDKKELKQLEYDEKLEILRKAKDDEISKKILAIEDKYNTQKERIESNRNKQIQKIDELLNALNVEYSKYLKVLEAINAQEEAIKVLLGDKYLSILERKILFFAYFRI